MSNNFLSFISDENGGTAIDYGLVAALVSLAALAAFQNFGASVNDVYDYISTNFADAANQ